MKIILSKVHDFNSSQLFIKIIENMEENSKRMRMFNVYFIVIFAMAKWL